MSLSGNDFENIRSGISFLWNNRFDEAEKIFGEQKDTSPRYALHHAEVVFLKSFITADVNDTLAAIDRLQHARKLAETNIKAYEAGHAPGDPTKKITNPELFNRLLDARIILGDSLYMHAILQMTRNEKLKGALNLRKSWKVFESALRERKNHKEIDDELSKCLEFGAGFFLFAMSIIPPKFLKFIELAGFKADRDGGLHYIRETHKSGSIRAPFATMVLLFNNLLLPRGVANVQQYLVEADSLIKESLDKYPKGSLFQVMGSHSARKQCNVELGIKYMEDALENCSHLKQEPLIYKYELANCYCMKLDWTNAVQQFTPLIQQEKFQVRIICALQLAGAIQMTGDSKKAHDLYVQLQSWQGKKSQFDQTAQRQAKRYVANGGHFSAFELLYLRRDLAKMLPIMPKVLESLESVAVTSKANEKKVIVAAKPASGFGKLAKLGAGLGNKIPFGKKKDQDYQYDDRASYLLLKGSMLKALTKYEEAVACYREVIDELAEVLVEKMFVPYCCYELGECYYIMGKLKEAEEYFKKCGKFSGYDWEDPLRVRLKVTFDQLKKGEVATAPPSLDQLADKLAETKIDDKEIDESQLNDDEDDPEFKEEDM